MATASTQEIRAATELPQRLDATIRAKLHFTFTLAGIASTRGGTRTRVGRVLWT